MQGPCLFPEGTSVSSRRECVEDLLDEGVEHDLRVYSSHLLQIIDDDKAPSVRRAAICCMKNLYEHHVNESEDCGIFEAKLTDRLLVDRSEHVRKAAFAALKKLQQEVSFSSLLIRSLLSC